jgi:hypothetical protein
MAEGTTAIDLALTTEGDADGTDLITFAEGAFSHSAGPPSGALQYIANHEEIAARKLAPPFWGKPNVAALLSSFMREIQTLEDTVWEMLELRTLRLADLPRLKVLGKIVGQPRLAFDTESYRLLIEARGLANVSRGRGSDLLAVLNLLLGEGEYTLLAVGNATLFLTALQPVNANGLAMVAQILPDTRGGGVGLQFLFSSDAFPDVFVWGDEWGSPEQWGTVRIL